MHYEISKHLLKESSTSTYDSPLALGRMTFYAALSHGKSRSTNMRWCDVIKKVIEMDNSVNEDDRDSFVHRIFQMIENKHNDEFFTHMVKNLRLL